MNYSKLGKEFVRIVEEIEQMQDEVNAEETINSVITNTFASHHQDGKALFSALNKSLLEQTKKADALKSAALRGARRALYLFSFIAFLMILLGLTNRISATFYGSMCTINNPEYQHPIAQLIPNADQAACQPVTATIEIFQNALVLGFLASFAKLASVFAVNAFFKFRNKRTLESMNVSRFLKYFLCAAIIGLLLFG